MKNWNSTLLYYRDCNFCVLFLYFILYLLKIFLFRHYIIIIFLEFLIRKNCFSSLIKLCFKFWHMTGDKKILSCLIMSLYYMSKFQVKMYTGSSHGVEKEPGETLHYANAHYERVYAYTIKSLIGLGRVQTRPEVRPVGVIYYMNPHYARTCCNSFLYRMYVTGHVFLQLCRKIYFCNTWFYY